MDITIISDSPLLEHDAMYMVQHYEKARQRLLEIRARDERRMKLAAESGIDVEELARREKEQAEARKQSLESDKAKIVAKKEKKVAEPKKEEKKAAKKPAKKKDDGKMMSFDEKGEESDDLF